LPPSQAARPHLDGFQTLSAIRGGANADLPVIMLTSRSDAAFVQRAAALKIAGYVVKPTSPNILGARVNAVRRTID
jgi:DNA-binding response OmpR family regulator